MEEASPVKLSVAELAGKFKSHPLPMPRNDGRKPVRSPPCSVQLRDQTDSESEKEKLAITPQPPPKAKLKNSSLIEKLQAAPLCPISPCSPQSPNLRPPQQDDANEVPISFEQPAEGTTLPNFNKSRVRLSFKRRPPTRQHRKSSGEEGVADTPEENKSLCDLHSPDNIPDKNGNTKDALNVPQEGTQESQGVSTPPITVQDTELQEEQNDGTQDDDGTEDTDRENKEAVAEENLEAADNRLEEKALEEHSIGEMEGSKKEEASGESSEENMDEENHDQDQASGD